MLKLCGQPFRRLACSYGQNQLSVIHNIPDFFNHNRENARLYRKHQEIRPAGNLLVRALRADSKPVCSRLHRLLCCRRAYDILRLHQLILQNSADDGLCHVSKSDKSDRLNCHILPSFL